MSHAEHVYTYCPILTELVPLHTCIDLNMHELLKVGRSFMKRPGCGGCGYLRLFSRRDEPFRLLNYSRQGSVATLTPSQSTVLPAKAEVYTGWSDMSSQLRCLGAIICLFVQVICPVELVASVAQLVEHQAT